MAYQNLFEALQNVCGFTALESDMFEIINAYEKDKAEQLPQADVIKSVCDHIWMKDEPLFGKSPFRCTKCGITNEQTVL